MVEKLACVIYRLLILMIVLGGTYSLTGSNVCTHRESYATSAVLSEQKPYMEKQQSWCLPGLCSQSNVKYRTYYNTEIIRKTRSIQECCAGYVIDLDKDICVPSCPKSCIMGECHSPDFCKCEIGYDGPQCDIPCLSGFWGMGCEKQCVCKNGALCDPLDGSCDCTPGWKGKDCSELCDDGSYGKNCAEKCRCIEGPPCDHISGKCKCSSKFTGPLCDQECANEKCGEDCRCQNGGECTGPEGYCVCTIGWVGLACAEKCSKGWWGDKCMSRCNCDNESSCDPITGYCDSAVGFTVKSCDGTNCLNTNLSENSGNGSIANGMLVCEEGWTGDACQNRVCSDTTYGEKCDKVCLCNPATTKLCHPRYGDCECRPGWDGKHCNKKCPFSKFGKGCHNNCTCLNNALCSPINGKCICAPGYKGERCELKCPTGWYGKECSMKCDCHNDATCSNESGKCICTEGWIGKKCTEKCNCNGSPCNSYTGVCTCIPGKIGLTCDEKCPMGRWGIECRHKCSCSVFENCQERDGNCTERIVERLPSNSSGKGAVTLMDTLLVLTLMLICKTFHSMQSVNTASFLKNMVVLDKNFVAILYPRET